MKKRIYNMDIADMKRVCAATPIELFLNPCKTFPVSISNYGHLIGRVGHLKVYEMCAARLLDFFRRVFVKEQRNVGCTVDTLRSLYLSRDPGDKMHFDQAFWHLVKCGTLFRTPSGMVTLVTFHQYDCIL